ncbi:Nucleoside diphosphate kinase-like 5 [Holothuria leucospilota]|uniref:Nucleoside diphosphate kinase homolog 5 n=1 Tax=Holothuria leucospilota TaxID=206669 RepID=A0A9Q0YLN6_HOLLE|nr:Nucleoside diphosphate kinase-like 5 [Holothuria leucospilota]
MRSYQIHEKTTEQGAEETVQPCQLLFISFEQQRNSMTEEEINTDLMQPPQIYVERTLAIIKPDAIHKADEIEEIILRSGFTILSKRRIHLTPEQASDFYAEHYGKMFFPSLVAYMSSGPIIVMVLARENAIPYWRELCGPTHSVKARETHPESFFFYCSIRALYGFDDQRNAVHGSDGIISAEREIRFMFNSSIVEPIPMKQAAKDYLERAVNVTLLAGLTELCKQKPEDPVKWLADWLVANNPNKPTIGDTYKVEEA